MCEETTSTPEPSRKRKHENHQNTELIDVIRSSLTTKDDEEKFGEYVAQSLASIQDPTIRKLLKEHIKIQISKHTAMDAEKQLQMLSQQSSTSISLPSFQVIETPQTTSSDGILSQNIVYQYQLCDQDPILE